MIRFFLDRGDYRLIVFATYGFFWHPNGALGA
jgi:hypothetical protein